jgi:tRNA ligase
VSCPGEVDDVVEMDIQSDGLEDAVTTAAKGLVELISGLEMPQGANIEEACEVARGYKVSVRKEDGGGRTIKKAPIRYYAFLPEFKIEDVIKDTLAIASGYSGDKDISNAFNFWKQLEEGKRLNVRPHITIAHVRNLPESQAVWDACVKLDTLLSSPPAPSDPSHAQPPPTSNLFGFRLGTLLCDGNAMSVTVEDVRPQPTGSPDAELRSETHQPHQDFLDALPDEVKSKLHITIGTKDESVKAIQGGLLVTRWKNGDKSVIAIPVRSQNGIAVGRLRGMVG